MCRTQLVHKKTGFYVSQKNREAYVLQVQALMSEMYGGASANDLVDGDSGVENRSVRRRRVTADGEQVSDPSIYLGSCDVIMHAVRLLLHVVFVLIDVCRRDTARSARRSAPSSSSMAGSGTRTRCSRSSA